MSGNRERRKTREKTKMRKKQDQWNRSARQKLLTSIFFAVFVFAKQGKKKKKKRVLKHGARPDGDAVSLKFVKLSKCYYHGNKKIALLGNLPSVVGQGALSAVSQGAGRGRGPQKSFRDFVSESGRFRVQISLWLLWKEQSRLHSGPFGRGILGAISGGPFFSRPPFLLLTLVELL